MDRLRDAAAEGRLTFEELADRIDGAAGAVTRADLERLTEDLPQPTASPARAPAPAPTSPAPTRASVIFGDVRRSGAWTVPAGGRWNSVFGDIVLDLREARVSAAEVHIDAGTLFGDIELLVPEGVEVEIRAQTLLGGIRQKSGESGAAGAPRILLTGGTVFGDVTVHHQRLRERLAERFTGRRRLEPPR